MEGKGGGRGGMEGERMVKGKGGVRKCTTVSVASLRF